MTQAKYAQTAKTLAVVKGQLNACKTRFMEISMEAGDLRMGAKEHEGTDRDLIGVQCYALCLSVESLFGKVDALTDLIRHKANLPVLKPNEKNYMFQTDMKKQIEKIRDEIKDMSPEEKETYLASMDTLS